MIRVTFFSFFIFLWSCHGRNTYDCNSALQEIKMLLSLDSLGVDIDDRMFCEGWVDGKDIENFVFFINGNQENTLPCIYCDVVNNNGHVEFTDNGSEYMGISFDDKPFSYYLGINKRMCDDFGVEYPISRCNSSNHIDSRRIEMALKKPSHTI